MYRYIRLSVYKSMSPAQPTRRAPESDVKERGGWRKKADLYLSSSISLSI